MDAMEKSQSLALSRVRQRNEDHPVDKKAINRNDQERQATGR